MNEQHMEDRRILGELRSCAFNLNKHFSVAAQHDHLFQLAHTIAATVQKDGLTQHPYFSELIYYINELPMEDFREKSTLARALCCEINTIAPEEICIS